PRRVVDAVDLTVGAGELCAVVGPNGAGKTTLLRLAAGLLAPAAGRVRIGGDDPALAPRRALARRLAFLPQSYRLAFPFTVTEVVLMGRYAHRGPGLLGLERADDVAAAAAALERCQVRDLADRRFDQLSGGEQRRVLLAQAFCQAVEVLLLDEPTASLDPAHAIAVLEAVRGETARGAAALLVTHDLVLAARTASRVIVLEAGRVRADGPPAQVLASPEAARAFGVPLHVGTLPDGTTPFVVPA
ncbi:MAG TPA: ABC transporter ATP-binding protein, partial [Kofleriaceae bacterium]|nr:ABC transporter ATP-binding protein [Kofleriaceae bacterium]